MGCSGRGVSGPPDTPIIKETPPSLTLTLDGLVSKGPVLGSTVTVFLLESGKKGTILTQGLSDASGRFTLLVPASTKSFFIEAQGGVYQDEATGLSKTLVQTMCSVVPLHSPTRPAMITPLTHMATSILETQPLITAKTMQDSLDKVASFFSLPDILHTTPATSSSGSGQTSHASQYGLILAGISQLANQKSVTDPGIIVEALSQDISDGVFDGKQDSTILTLGSTEVGAGLGTAALARAIEDFSSSSQNSSSAQADPLFLTNLKASDGVIANPQISFSVLAIPELTHGTVLTVKGFTIPGGITLTGFNATGQIARLITGFDGNFSLALPLEKNSLNQLRLEASDGFSLSEKRFSVREDSLAPQIHLSSSPAGSYNTSSILIGYSLSDEFGLPSTLSASISTGSLGISSQNVLIESLPEGKYTLTLKSQDQLGNSTSQSFLLDLDLSAPQIVSALPGSARANLNLSLDFSEPLTQVNWRFFPASSSSSLFTSFDPEFVSEILLDFQGIQGEHLLEVTASDPAGNPLSVTTSIIFDSLVPQFLSSPSLPLITRELQFLVPFQVEEGAQVILALTSPDSSINRSTSATSSLDFQLNAIEGPWTVDLLLEHLPANHSLIQPQVILDTTAPPPPSLSPETFSTSADTIIVQISGETGTEVNLNSLATGMILTSTPLTFLLTPTPNANSNFEFSLQDRAGNQSQASQINGVHDNNAPAGIFLDSNSSSSGIYLTGGDHLIFSYELSQIETGITVEVDFLGKTHLLESLDGAGFSTSIQLSQFETEDSNPVYTLKALDALLNSDSRSQTLAQTVDTLAPVIQSINFSSLSSQVGINRTASINLTLSKTEPEAVLQAYFLSLPLIFTTSDSRTFSTLYTPKTTHPQSLPNPFYLDFSVSDPAGNTTTQRSTASFMTDTAPPQVLMISNNQQDAGFLKSGDTILFTFSLDSPQPDLQVSAQYNGTPVTFTAKEMGAYYEGLYTLEAGHPNFNGTPPQIIVSSVIDLAGNTANLSSLTTTTGLIPVGKAFDNSEPKIQGVSLDYLGDLNNSMLIPGDSINLMVTLTETSTFPDSGSTPLALSGTLNSETLSFQQGSNPYIFHATYPITTNTPASMTGPELTLRAQDAVGNLSAQLTTHTSFPIDTDFVEPQSVKVSSDSTSSRKISSDLLNFSFRFGSLPNLLIISASAKIGEVSTDLNFLPGSNPFLFTTNLSIPNQPIVTTEIKLENVVFKKPSGSSSSPRSYSLNAFSLSGELTSPILIDTLKPQVERIEFLATDTELALKESVEFSVFPTYGDLSSLSITPTLKLSSMTLNLSYNGISLPFLENSSGLSYSATYTLETTHKSQPTALDLTAVFFIDSQGRVGLPASTSVDFILDTSPPIADLTSLAVVSSSLSNPLKIGDSLVFSLSPASVSSAVSLTGSFNASPLTFSSIDGFLSFQATYIILAGAPDGLNPSSPLQLTGLQFGDSAGNFGSLTQTVSLTHLIDANAPAPSEINFSPDFADTLAIGESLSFSVDLVGDAEPDLSVLGVFRGTPLSFLPSLGGARFSTSYTVPASPAVFSTGEQLILTLTDSAGNSTTTSTTGLLISVDAIPPTITGVITKALTSNANYIGIGSSILFSIGVSAGATAAGVDQIQNVTGAFNGVSLNFEKTNTDTLSWEALYTLSELSSPGSSESPFHQTTPQVEGLQAYDLAGNPSPILTNLSLLPGSLLTHVFDTVRPTIQSITATSTTTNLTATDILEFTLKASTIATDVIQASGVFNSVSLSFINTGVIGSFHSTYTVLTTHTNQSDASNPPQLNAFLTDLAGNIGPSLITSSLAFLIITTDIHPPELVSVSSLALLTPGTAPPSSEYLKIGDSLQFSVLASSASTDINLVTASYNGEALSFGSTDSSHWLATYTLTSGHPSQSATLQLTNILAHDLAGNVSNSIATTDVDRILDASSPAVLSIIVTGTGPLLVLTVGNNLEFQLTPELNNGSAETGGFVSGSYNLVPLIWTEEPSSGGLYSATYTAQTTHKDQSNPLQITNVIFFDQAGNPSPPASSSASFGGVTVTIDTSIPGAPSVSPLRLATNTASTTLSVAAEAGTSLFINSVFHSTMDSSATTTVLVSLNDASLNSFSFKVQDESSNESQPTTAEVYRSSLVTMQILTSSFSGLKTTNIRLQHLSESEHDPGKFFLASRAGFGELDLNGEVYTDLNQGLPSGTVKDFSEHPDLAQSSTLILLQDSALFKSSDRGLNWFEIASPSFSGKTLQALLFHPPAPANVYIATDQNLFKSSDTGETYADFNTNGPSPQSNANRDVRALTYDATNARLYVGTLEGLYYSNQSGTNWSSLQTDSVDILSLSIPPSQSETLLLISTSAFLRTTNLLTNSGTPSFEEITPTTGSSPGDVNALALTTQPGRVFLATLNGIYESSDQGSTWSTPQATGSGFSGPNYSAIASDSTNPNRLLLGNNRALTKVLNNTASPYTVNDLTGILPPAISSLAIPSSTTTSFFAITEMWVYRYTQTENSWNLISNQSPVSTFTFAEPLPGPKTLFLGNRKTGLSTMSYSGSNLSTLSLNINNPVTHVTSILFHPFATDTLLIGTETFGLHYSRDQGGSWTTSVNGIGIQSVWALGVNPDGSEVFASTSTSVLKATDLTSPESFSWSSSGDCGSQGSVTDIEVVSDTDGVYLIGSGELYQASNDCTTITTLTGNLDPAVLSAKVMTLPSTSTRILYLGTQEGLYKSLDNGSNFTLMPASILMPILDLIVVEDRTDHHKLFLGTQAGGYLIEDIKPD